jgi:hypothetical protein
VKNKIIRIVALSTFFSSYLGSYEIQDQKINENQDTIDKYLKWSVNFFDSLDENSSVGDMVDFLITFRNSLHEMGYDMPLLTDLSCEIRNYLVENGIKITDEEFSEIYGEICLKEQSSIACLYGNSIGTIQMVKKHRERKEGTSDTKIKSKSAFGLLKCLAGALICIIPVPVIQAVGAGLVLNGINDCIDDAREQGDENEKIQKMDEIRRQEGMHLTHP